MRKNYVFLFNFKAFPATYIIEKGEKPMNYLLHSGQGIYRYYDDKKDRVMEITTADFIKKKNMDIRQSIPFIDITAGEIQISLFCKRIFVLF